MNLFDPANVRQAKVTFGASPTAAPFGTFDNSGVTDNAAITLSSAAGVNGAFTATNSSIEVGSPGVLVLTITPTVTGGMGGSVTGGGSLPVGSAVASGGEGYTGGLERGGQLAEQRFSCRSVYLPAIRGRVFESLAEFDGVDGSVVTGQRTETTVPSQSLYLLNSPYVLGLANTAAQRLMKEASESFFL